MQPQPGQILLGKYRVERVLGVGGMGVVVAATHLVLDQLVAIKFMLGPEKPAAVSRFVREARVTVRLKSPHVARIFDVAALDDGTPYIVLEYLEGKDLSDVLHERGPLPIREAIDAVLQASEALIEAHAAGIIHRDLKPANLFVTRNADGSPCIKVLDFGIARWNEGGTEKLHGTGVIGSAPYMAPEQIAAPSRVDARTDVWALGATLFELLTGTTPFQHDPAMTMHAMIHAVLHNPPLRPSSLRPDLPAELEAVLLRCLEKDGRKRWGSTIPTWASYSVISRTCRGPVSEHDSASRCTRAVQLGATAACARSGIQGADCHTPRTARIASDRRRWSRAAGSTDHRRHLRMAQPIGS